MNNFGTSPFSFHTGFNYNISCIINHHWSSTTKNGISRYYSKLRLLINRENCFAIKIILIKWEMGNETNLNCDSELNTYNFKMNLVLCRRSILFQFECNTDLRSGNSVLQRNHFSISIAGTSLSPAIINFGISCKYNLQSTYNYLFTFCNVPFILNGWG